MISNNELKALIAQIEARGATAIVMHDRQALASEGREIITEVYLQGVAGVGPHGMSPISAAERIREVLARVIEVGKLYDVPSGMGGAFTVQALCVRGDDVDCRVYMPKNPDWHGYMVVAKAVAMKALKEPAPRNNWVEKFRKAVAS